MSTIILSLCWPLELSSTQKLVLISLADQANDEGVCWPSIASLMKRTCLSERAVRNALRSLEEVRLLRTSGREGSSNWYTVTPRAYTPAPDAPRHDVPPPGAPRAGDPGTTCPPPRHHVPPEPSLNHHGTVSEPPAPAAKPKRSHDEAARIELDTLLPNWVPRDLWDAWWLGTRKKIRAPNTPDALTLNLRTLARLRDEGHDPRAVIESSIEHGYRGLFPPKARNGQNHTPGRRESDSERAERLANAAAGRR